MDDGRLMMDNGGHMTRDDLKKRTKEFAHRCIKLTAALPNSYLGNHLRNQLTRSATSVAANYRAACLAQTRPSFIAKLSIVVEEIDETLFWLEFICEEELIEKTRMYAIQKEANELTAIFISTRKTASKSK